MMGGKGLSGPKERKDLVTESSFEASGAWVPAGPQPGVAPGGQGEVGLPRKHLHHLQRTPGGGPPGAALPSSLPPGRQKHQQVAPISPGDGDCVGGAPRRRGGAGAEPTGPGLWSRWPPSRGTWPLLLIPCSVDFQGRRPTVPSRVGIEWGLGWDHRGFTFSTKQ